MAIRRLNFTGRKKIKRSDVAVTVRDSAHGRSTFSAEVSLDSYDLPPEAKVFIEAHRQTSYMRFSFGTVAHTAPEDELVLSEFDPPEAVLFRIKVTSSDDPAGLLLAAADQIRPSSREQADDRRIPLLRVRTIPALAQQVYRVDFSDDAGGPVLCINKHAGDHRAVLRDPLVQSLVLPAVLREVLNRVLHIDEVREIETDGGWASDWLTFATHLSGVERDLPSFQDESEIDDWIDDVTGAFCRTLRSMDQFLSSFSVEG